jgi:Membrane-fusion protein
MTMSTPESALRPLQARRRVPVFLIVVLVLIVLAVWGIVDRIDARANLRRATAAASVVSVTTILPTPGQGSASLILPGNVEAYADAPIYARTSGYLKRWYVDIGGAVKAGQVLAVIESPEVDQQLRQAQADLATAQANYQLAQSTANRWKNLLATESVSQQDADEKNGDALAKKRRCCRHRPTSRVCVNW